MKPSFILSIGLKGMLPDEPDCNSAVICSTLAAAVGFNSPFSLAINPTNFSKQAKELKG